jgi:hypothetical protein
VSFSLAGGSWPWLVPALVVVLALGVWAYRFAVPALAPAFRRSLALLRAVALLALLLLLARPLLSLADRASSRTVVLLEDVSLSMDLPGRTAASRREESARALDELQRRLGGRASVRRWQFAGRVAEANANAASDSSRSLVPAATDLGGALAEVGRLADLVAVVVVSDGVVNRGGDPVQAARRIGRPVSAVVVGEAPPWDTAIEEVAIAPLARLGEPSALEVRLSHNGESGRRARLELSDGATVLVSRSISLPAGGEEVVERLSFTPRRLGLSQYRVRLDAGADETITDNNQRAAVQRVLPDRQRVLVVAPTLQWDFTWLQRALAADSAFAADFALSGRDGFRAPQARSAAGSPVDVEPFERYVVIVLQGLAPERLPPGAEEKLASYVRGGGSLVLWGGPGGEGATLGEWLDSPLGRTLGLQSGRSRSPSEVKPELPSGEIAHDLVRLDDDVERNRRYFASLPPLTRVFPIAQRPGDRAFLTGAQGEVLLVALRRAGRGQALVINGAGLWRWGTSGIDPLAPTRYRRFWAQALRLLSEPLQTEPLRVAAERPLVARGEPVRVTASLQDRTFQPVSGASVSARVEQVEDAQGRVPSRPAEREARLAEAADGSYEAAFDALPPGRYRVAARARHRETGESIAEAEFVVDSWTPEALATRPDGPTLTRMAAASGGEAAESGNLERLAGELGEAVSRPSRWRELRLWEEPIVYLALLGLLAGEWWNRRRRGLP